MRTSPNESNAGKKDWILNLLIPAAYLFITLCIDYSIPYSTITPLMGISGLMVFAFRLQPLWMIFWATIYAITVACIFLTPGFYAVMSGNLRVAPDPVTPWLRTATFCLGAILSSILCITMKRLVASEKSMRELIGKLPVPVLTSDINGDIVFSNAAANELIECSGRSLSKNYFDIFPPDGHQGTLIAAYLAKFSRDKGDKPLLLSLNGSSLIGKTHLLDKSTRPLLMTIIEQHNEANPSGPEAS